MTTGGLYERVMASADPDSLPRPRIRASAGVVPWRRGADGMLEVFWVKRSPSLPFMGGFHAFPGGGRSSRDSELEIVGRPVGIDEDPTDGAIPKAVLEGHRLEPVLADGVLGCALRELFEETGLLLVVGETIGQEGGERRRLLQKKLDFYELAQARSWRFDASRLVYAGRWLTPPLAPIRFDNRFFLLEWQDAMDVEPEVCGAELVEGEWVRPAEALERWRQGEVITAPPILHILNVLSTDDPDVAGRRLRVPDEMNLGPHRRIEFRPGVLLFPLVSATLPPATHTNSFVVGTGEAVLVDPGSSDADQIGGMIDALRVLETQGRKVTAIWLTHHHPDHVGGVETMRRELQVPVLAHSRTASRLAERGITVDEMLEDGQRIVLAGDPPFPVRIVHTPGHTAGHLVFLDETFGSLLAGDLTAGIGTIVIDPPEGDLDDYLGSLQKALELPARTLFPAHGPPAVAVDAKLREVLAHRLWREERVLDAWRRGLRGKELLADVYRGTPAIALPLAQRQLQAHLLRLRRLGQILVNQEGHEE